MTEHKSPRFATTRWSLVARAQDSSDEARRAALSGLCESYWFPVYAHVRRSGVSPTDAEDRTQSFFARFLERDDVRLADPQRGRFRAFLLACVRSHLANERDHKQAQKRGGGRAIRSFDAMSAEERYLAEPATDGDAERTFDASWARTVLARVLDALREQYAGDGQSALFDALKPALTGAPIRPYADLAAELNSTEGALKTAVHRLRRRFGERLRAEVAETTSDPADIDGELHVLLDALRDRSSG